jgi:hypothetical protein
MDVEINGGIVDRWTDGLQWFILRLHQYLDSIASIGRRSDE